MEVYSPVNNFQLERKEASNVSVFWERWFWSSNAKDIGTLYLMFALFAGLVGTPYSVLIRIELSAPGVQYISDNQLYNSIITAHAIVMIFFMVKLSAFNLVIEKTAWPGNIEIFYSFFHYILGYL